MKDESSKNNVLKETMLTSTKEGKTDHCNSTNYEDKVTEKKIEEEQMSARIPSQGENESVNSNSVEKSDSNTNKPKSEAHSVNKSSISPKKKLDTNASEANIKEESMKQVKSNTNNTLLEKCTQNLTDTSVNSLNSTISERTDVAKTVITVIKIQHNSVANTDNIYEHKSPNKNLCHKDGLVLNKGIEHTPNKLKNSPMETIVNKDNGDNTVKKNVLHEMTLDIVKSETHLAGCISADASIENNRDNEVVHNTSATVNIETLLLTPKRASEVLDQIKTEICMGEAPTVSPHVTTPKNVSDCNIPQINSYPIQNSNMQQTPPSSKKIKTLFECDSLKGSPVGTKMEKDTTLTDSECLSDTFKSELCDPDRINEFEAIDMLHDLDAVINFEDSKIADCALLSPFSYDCFAQNVNDKPDVDPLFIEPSEQKMQSPMKPKSNSSKRKGSVIQESRKKRRKSVRLRHRMNGKSAKNEDNTKVEERMDEDEENVVECGAVGEDEEDLSDDFEKLRDLRVQLLHVAPPQHALPSLMGVTGTLTPDLVQEFEKYGPLKRDRYSSEEDEIIIKNWKLFCKTHGLSPANIKPFVRIRQNGIFTMRQSKERQKFVQFLGNGLPWRSIFSIYKRFKHLHSCNKITSQVPYSTKEDKKILAFVRHRVDFQNMSTIFCHLAKILGRPSKSLRDRYKTLTKQQSSNGSQSLVRIRWSLPLITEYIKTLIDITLSDNIAELKHAVIPTAVWKKCEEKLKINSRVLRNFWHLRLHMQLFCKKPIYLNDIKISLIEYLYGVGISSKRDIIWSKVVKYFDGFTVQFLQHTVSALIGKYEKTKSFIEIIEILHDKEILQIQQCETDKYLPRFSYNNGIVEIVDDYNSDNEQ